MAKNVTETIVCDKCGGPDAEFSFTISDDSGVSLVDLCAKCAKPVAALKAKGTSTPRSRAHSPKRPSGHAVIPVD